jgi:hypothetical protein
MTTADPQAEAMAGLTTGLVTAIAHVFNCLDQRGICRKLKPLPQYGRLENISRVRTFRRRNMF